MESKNNKSKMFKTYVNYVLRKRFAEICVCLKEKSLHNSLFFSFLFNSIKLFVFRMWKTDGTIGMRAILSHDLISDLERSWKKM